MTQMTCRKIEKSGVFLCVTRELTNFDWHISVSCKIHCNLPIISLKANTYQCGSDPTRWNWHNIPFLYAPKYYKPVFILKNSATFIRSVVIISIWHRPRAGMIRTALFLGWFQKFFTIQFSPMLNFFFVILFQCNKGWYLSILCQTGWVTQRP